ncbi:hypothetical protein BN2476_670090 [Paraburkholderia piptadeniae]|uniref:Uncharacterized protein n=1 Tax=Paraburkholderia piptadeniae TaxID=1701573 RepID=A0A1N7SNR0_9BURK|nr:hypothetical protein BN2476_670090 [Paraburkholderia piptadeniae]
MGVTVSDTGSVRFVALGEAPKSLKAQSKHNMTAWTIAVDG